MSGPCGAITSPSTSRSPRPTAGRSRPRRSSAGSRRSVGLYTYALDLALIDRHPRGHGKRLKVDAKRVQGAAALSKAEFERFVTAAREHSPDALAIVLLLGLYGLRVSEVCDLQLEQLDHNHGQPVLCVAGKGRAANETGLRPHLRVAQRYALVGVARRAQRPAAEPRNARESGSRSGIEFPERPRRCWMALRGLVAASGGD